MRKLIILALGVLAACDAADTPATAPTPPDDATVAYIALSNPRPLAGDTIVLTVRSVAGPGAEDLGSFAARLHLGRGLGFVESAGVTEGAGAMRLAADTVIAAGASPTGFRGRLFAMRVVVLDPRLLGDVAVSFSEATTIQFVSQSKSLRIESGVFRDVR